MAENVEMIRPINLPEAQQLSENDVFILDSETGGVRKIPKNKVYTPVDDTLSESGEAADAKVTGEKIAEVKAETALIQNPVGNKSGELVSFSDGADMPAKSVIVNITPKQSGTGTPSPDNVRPISGWESVSVYDTGVNVWDEEWELGNIDVSSGANVSSTTQIRSKNYIPVRPNTTIYLYGAVGGTFNYRFYKADKSYLRGTYYGANQTLAIPEEAYYMRFVMGASYGTTYNNDISINYPSTDHEYHAYNGTTTTVNLGRTVYGGEAEIVGGSLTDKMGVVDLGTLNWIDHSSGVFWAIINGKAKGVNNIVCSQYETASTAGVGNLQNNQIVGEHSGSAVYIKDTRFTTDTTAFKSAMSGVQLVYELHQPQTYQLTPTEVKTLLGDNNVWADSGDVEITYRKDINIVIDELTNAIVSLGSNV